MARTAAVVAATGAVLLAAAVPAGAQGASGHLTGHQSATAVSVAQSDPMVFGLGVAGLFWLLAGLLALVVGLALATRRARRPAGGAAADSRAAGTTSTSTSWSKSTSTSTSHDRAGGAER